MGAKAMNSWKTNAASQARCPDVIQQRLLYMADFCDLVNSSNATAAKEHICEVMDLAKSTYSWSNSLARSAHELKRKVAELDAFMSSIMSKLPYSVADMQKHAQSGDPRPL